MHTEEIDSPSGHADGEIGGSAPQSVGAQAAAVSDPVAEPVPEPGPGVVEPVWLEPQAIKNPKQAARMCLVMT